MTLSACSHDKAVGRYTGWSPTSSAEFDSLAPQLLVDLIERQFDSRFPAHYDSVMTRLRVLSENNPGDRNMQIRIELIEHRRKNIDKQIGIPPVVHIDRDSYPHEYSQLELMEISRLRGEKSSQHLLKLDSLRNYFRDINDSLFTALTLNKLALIHWIHNNRKEALRMCKESDYIFWKLRLKRHRLNYSINMAMSSDSLEAMKIYNRLLDDTIIRESKYIQDIILRNAMNQSGKIEYALREVELAAGDSAFRDSEAVASRNVAQIYIECDSLALAKPYIMRAVELSDSVTEVRYRVGIFLTAANYYYAAERLDSATLYYRKFVDLNEKWVSEQLNTETIIQQTRNQLEQNKLIGEMNAARSRWIIVVSIMGLCIVFGIILTLLIRRDSKRKLQAAQTKMELNQSHIRLKANAIVMEQNDSLIEDLGNVVNRLSESGRLTQADNKDLIVKLSLHKAGSEERDTFLELSRKIDSEFFKRLKADYPSITESQLRLASYIASGLTNAQICRVLNIAGQSVKTARYRLRSKFGLSTSDSLEDFLRNYLSSGRNFH